MAHDGTIESNPSRIPIRRVALRVGQSVEGEQRRHYWKYFGVNPLLNRQHPYQLCAGCGEVEVEYH